tara:strand:+ start:2593 stop:3396 length:804 start_codon:yes stop_codon:yes gene_type:complete
MILKKILNKLSYTLRSIQFSYYKRKRKKYIAAINIRDIKKQIVTLNSEYDYFFHFFWNLSPDWLKNHRKYFSLEQRAFGEDAFHAMWHLLFKEYKPEKVLEIGVYRGSTLSLFALLAQKHNLNTEVHGISPFSPAGDSVSTYLTELDYYEDVKRNFSFFNLTPPILHKGFSNDPEMLKIIKSQAWDLIFIDGNHDYEIVKQDFIVCSQNIKSGGLIVLDDAALGTGYRSSFYSTSGHLGPSKIASEIKKDSFREILSVGHNRVFEKI